MPQILVVGSSGFIGRALLNHLEQSKCRAIGADIKTSHFNEALHLNLLDKEEVKASLARLKPKIIFHAAGCVDGEESDMDRAHVETTRNLLVAVLSTCPSARVVVLGSAAEYGIHGQRLTIKERMMAFPTTPYGRSKLRQSELAGRFALENGMDVVRFRIFNTLGPGQGPHLVAGALVGRIRQAIEKNQTHIEVYDPECQRDFLDVRDISRILWVATQRIDRSFATTPINLSSGIGTSIIEIARILLSAAKTSHELKVTLVPTSVPSRVIGDNSLLRKILRNESLVQIHIRQSLTDMWNASMSLSVR